MASISSLLKKAETARRQQRAYEENVAAFIWQNSAKTLDDWQTYRGFLQTRQEEATTGSDSLTYAKKLKTAEDQYVSAEIERATIDILDGKGTTTDKYERIVQLYQRAVERGNFDLAQNLYLQASRLEEQIINEQEKAQRVAGSLATNQVKSVEKLVDKINDEDTIEKAVQLGDGTWVYTAYGLKKDIAERGDTENGIFYDAYQMGKAIQEMVNDAYESASTQEAVDKIENDDKLVKILRGEYTYNIGDLSLNIDELYTAMTSAQANNPVYRVETTRNEKGETSFSLKKNKIEDFVWTRDENGMYSAVEQRTVRTDESLSTKLSPTGSYVGAEESFEVGDKVTIRDENGNIKEITLQERTTLAPYYDANSKKTVYVDPSGAIAIRDRLEQLGYAVIDSSAGGEYNGTFSIQTPDGRFISQATIQDGKVRYWGDANEYSQGLSGLYEINLYDAEMGQLGTLNAGTTRAVAPDEISDFGTESEFGGMSSQASALGKSYIMSLTGLSSYSAPRVNLDQAVSGLRVTSTPTQSLRGVSMDEPYRMGIPGTSQLLQQAGTRQNQLRERLLEQQREDARQRAQITAQATQSAGIIGLNQTPVRQTAQNDAPVKQLRVSTRKPTQKVQVTERPKTQKVVVDDRDRYSGFKLQVR